tara:strand:- start:8761 stop:9087 length:327 start_codon:yes stop_codon:yes gene_type:complete
MGTIKAALSMIHKFFAGILGLTIIDLAAIIDFDFLSDIDDTIKTVFIVLGLIFYILAIPHKLKMQSYKQREKKLDIQRKEMELDNDMDKQDLRKYKEQIGFKDEDRSI